MNKQLDNHTMQYNSYQVDNYAGIKTSPEVPMYQALAESLNLPAVATVNELGIDKAFDAGEIWFEYGKKLTEFLELPLVEVWRRILSRWRKPMQPLLMEV